jgi:hypothetical protein
MKRIFFAVLLVLSCLISSSTTTAQIPFEDPDVEYANDLRELGTLRKVFVHSMPDPLARQAIVKELNRERGLFEIVERPEDAEFYLVFYGLNGESADPFATSMGGGPVTTSGTLAAYRQVETCDGSRPRVLFITRKLRVIHAGIVVPLTPLNQGGLSSLNQPGISPRPFSGKRLGTEFVVRLGLFLLGKRFPSTLNFDQVNSSLSVSFSNKPEVQAAREFVLQVKEARKRQPPAARRLTSDWFDFSAPSAAPITLLEQTGAALPCQPKLTGEKQANYSGTYSVGDGMSNDTPAVARHAARRRRVGRAELNAPPQ